MHLINIHFVVVYHLFVVVGVVVVGVVIFSWLLRYKCCAERSKSKQSVESAQHSRNIMRDKRVLLRSEAEAPWRVAKPVERYCYIESPSPSLSMLSMLQNRYWKISSLLSSLWEIQFEWLRFMFCLYISSVYWIISVSRLECTRNSSWLSSSVYIECNLYIHFYMVYILKLMTF